MTIVSMASRLHVSPRKSWSVNPPKKGKSDKKRKLSTFSGQPVAELSYVNYQRQQRQMSASRRPISSIKSSRTQEDLGIQVQCIPAALSTREVKKPERPKSRTTTSQKAREQSNNDVEGGHEVTIPLRVHISLSVPPPSPVAPCTTPDSLSDEELDCFLEDANIESEDNESVSIYPSSRMSLSRGRRSSSTSSTMSGNSSYKSTPELMITSKQSQLQCRPRSNTRPNSCAKPDSGCYTRYDTPNKSRPQTRKSIFERSALVRTPRGSPDDALQIKRCSTPDDERKTTSANQKSAKVSGEKKGVIKVRKSDNAFVLSKDGSIKKCTIFVPIASDNESPSVSPTQQEVEITGVEEYVDFYKPVECHRPRESTDRNLTKVEKQESDNFKIIVKSRGKIVNIKESTRTKQKKQKQHSNSTPKRQSPIPNQSKHINCIDNDPLFVEGTDLLLSQFQHKTEDITFCDVLNSLNELNGESRPKKVETDCNASRDPVKKFLPAKSVLRVWNEKDAKMVDGIKKTKSNILNRTQSISKEAREAKLKVDASVSTTQCNKKAYSILNKKPPSTRKRLPHSKATTTLRTVSHYNYQTVVLSNSPGNTNKKKSF